MDDITAEMVGHKLYVLKNIVCEWWKNLGFICNGTFDVCKNSTTFKVNFNFNFDLFEDEKEKAKNLFGVLDLYSESQNDFVVIDNSKNREWILNKLKTRFPKIKIYKINSRIIYNQRNPGEPRISFPVAFKLCEIEASIQIEDIEENKNGNSA